MSPAAARSTDVALRGDAVSVATAVTLNVTTVALIADRSPLTAGRTGLILSAALALGVGVLIIGQAARRIRAGQPSAAESPRGLLGGAVALWGLGQLVISLTLAPDGARDFGVGDVLSTLAGPVTVLALLRMPRRSRSSRPGLRLGFDAALLAAALTLGVWVVVLEPNGGRDAGGAALWSAIGACFADLLVASVTVLVRAREPRDGALALAVGAILQAVADVSSLPAVLTGRPIGWMSGAVWCAAWPVIGLGLHRYWTTVVTREPTSLVEDLGETRASTGATLAAVSVLVGLPLLGLDPLTTTPAIVLGSVTLVLLTVREAVGSRQWSRLLNNLTTEALRDVLTGLPNRHALSLRMRYLPADAQHVLVAVDLDGFKEVNDLLGPDGADAVIVEVAGLLSAVIPPGAVAARLGGDEFGVLMPGSAQDGVLLADRLVAAMRTRPVAEGLRISACAGVGRVAEDRSAAFVEAAAAVRAAKARGRGSVAAYPGEVELSRERRLVLERRLAAAVAAGELEMHAQPQVDLASGRVRGFESLARWTDATLGPVGPGEFVPVAEATGLVGPLGEFALRRSLLDAVRTGAFARGLEVGVNVSPVQLHQPHFAGLVADLIAEFAVPPELVVLEVTEAILVDEVAAEATLARLAETGVRLAIDDFGTGYSALGYLRRLPVDQLKIDRSWVVAAVTDSRTRRIVGGVIELAHALGAIVVMEGIEDEATAAVCRELGADVGQGWLFGRPRPWEVSVAAADAAPSAAGPVPAPRAAAPARPERAVWE